MQFTQRDRPRLRRRAGAPTEPRRESEGVYSRVWRPIATGGPCAVLALPPLLRTSRCTSHRRRQHSHQQPPRSHAHLRLDYREHPASIDQVPIVCSSATAAGTDRRRNWRLCRSLAPRGRSGAAVDRWSALVSYAEGNNEPLRSRFRICSWFPRRSHDDWHLLSWSSFPFCLATCSYI